MMNTGAFARVKASYQKNKSPGESIERNHRVTSEALRPRLERGTPSLEGSCSIQLSYRSRKRGYTTTYIRSWQDKKIDS